MQQRRSLDKCSDIRFVIRIRSGIGRFAGDFESSKTSACRRENFAS
jgi:hypothetical protein